MIVAEVLIYEYRSGRLWVNDWIVLLVMLGFLAATFGWWRNGD